MFKRLVALVLVVLAGGVRLARSCPGTARNQRGYAHLQDGTLHRFDLWIPAADGLPFCAEWSQPAGGLRWCYGNDWS